MPRALLTDAEKRAVQDDPEMSESTVRTHLSNIRQKIALLEADCEILHDHRPDLYEQLHDSVCDDADDRRLRTLEARVDELEEEISALQDAD